MNHCIDNLAIWERNSKQGNCNMSTIRLYTNRRSANPTFAPHPYITARLLPGGTCPLACPRTPTLRPPLQYGCRPIAQGSLTRSSIDVDGPIRSARPPSHRWHPISYSRRLKEPHLLLAVWAGASDDRPSTAHRRALVTGAARRRRYMSCRTVCTKCRVI